MLELLAHCLCTGIPLAEGRPGAWPVAAGSWRPERPTPPPRESEPHACFRPRDFMPAPSVCTMYIPCRLCHRHGYQVCGSDALVAKRSGAATAPVMAGAWRQIGQQSRSAQATPAYPMPSRRRFRATMQIMQNRLSIPGATCSRLRWRTGPARTAKRPGPYLYSARDDAAHSSMTRLRALMCSGPVPQHPPMILTLGCFPIMSAIAAPNMSGVIE